MKENYGRILPTAAAVVFAIFRIQRGVLEMRACDTSRLSVLQQRFSNNSSLRYYLKITGGGVEGSDRTRGEDASIF